MKMHAILFLCLFSLLANTAFGQSKPTEDLVYLKNGWILRGNHSFSVGDSILTIRTKDGNTFVFAKDDVIRIEEVPRKRTFSDEFVIRDKGYTQLWSASMLWGSPDINAYSTAASLHAQTLHGYKFNQYLSVSGGLGFSLYGPGLMMPLLADIRGDLGKGSVRFHYYAQGGFALPLYDREGIWGVEEEDVFQAFGGAVYDQGFGVHIFTRRKLSWIWTVGYRIQQNREVYDYPWGTRSDQRYTYRRLGFSLGMMF